MIRIGRVKRLEFNQVITYFVPYPDVMNVPLSYPPSLGKGGMGEVYLAEDTRLKREVAIKILPESVRVGSWLSSSAIEWDADWPHDGQYMAYVSGEVISFDIGAVEDEGPTIYCDLIQSMV